MDTSHSLGRTQQPNPQIRSPTSENVDPINPRRKFRRRGTQDSDTDNEMHSSTSESEEVELDEVGSDAGWDEESGLAGEERRKYLHQKRQRDKLDARIAGENALSVEEKRQADKDVVKSLLINAILIGSWYFFSLSISIYNKWMFSDDHLNFHYPLFTTSLHMLVQFILASAILFIFPSLRPRNPNQALPGQDTAMTASTIAKPLITPLFYFTRLVPTGTTTSLDIGLGNTSLRYITLTFYTMCKSSVLIFVLLFAFLFRLEAPSWRLLFIILTMTLGVLMMVFGETAFHALGFVLALSASFFSGFRWALTQILLLHHPATCNPFATLFFLAPIMFLTLFLIALVSETPAAVIEGLNVLVEKEGLAKSLLLMFIPGMLAFCMICSEFTLLKRTSVVTLSICGIFKEVVTISAAGIVFHDELSVVNVSGLIVTIASIASYNYLKVTKMRREARERLAKKDDDDDDDVLGDGTGVRRRRKSRSRSGGDGVPDEADMPLMDGEESRPLQKPNGQRRSS